MANLLVVYDAYYATDWKKLVSPRSPSIWSGEEVAPELMQRLMSGEALTVEELMKLSGATDELSGLSTTLDKIIEDFGVPLPGTMKMTLESFYPIFKTKKVLGKKSKINYLLPNRLLVLL